MKKFFVIFLSVNFYLISPKAQDIPPVTEQQLENLTDADQSETEDDSYILELEQFRKNPLNLNTANADELRELKIITDLQIENLISYRRLFGNFISIYELQAVPSWDIATIRRLLPFITITSPFNVAEDFPKRFKNGENSLLLRFSQIMERSDGFNHNTSGTKYLGSPQKIFFRYRYSYKNLLQFGLAGDKDAGEQFFKGAQKNGFDFYSFHFFARKIGIIQDIGSWRFYGKHGTRIDTMAGNGFWKKR